MARRGPASSASSRPQTSANRPPTSGDFYAQDVAYSIEFDDEEESDEEDVFAFVPPSTADQRRDQRILPSSLLRHDPSEPPFGLHVAFPASVYNPHQPPSPGPSNPANVLAIHHQFASHIPVETPPSTESAATDDPYRLRRIVSTTSPIQQSPWQVDTSPRTDSRQLRISLSPSDNLRDEELAYSTSRKEYALSTRGSLPSAIDEESRTESIKISFDFDAVNEEEDSPYPEVRASVSNIDDPDMPTMTIRLWIIGLFLCVIGSALNVYFNFRQPAPSVIPLALVLIGYPIGKVSAYVLPITTYRLPRWLGGWEFSLNPGPWNIKEHVLVFIMANVSISPPFAINASVVAEVYYGVTYSFWFDVIFVLATQLTGFGLAGICRRFLVWPASMVWPQNLVACTLLNTLHAEEEAEGEGIGRYKFFMYVFGAAFLYYFLPGFLFTALSVFSWVCWIAPNNIPVNQLFGVYNGLGLSVITFDWSQISWISSPLMTPWWAEVQIFIGFIFFFWFLTPLLYYTNTWEFAHFPIAASQPYDRFGQTYDIQRVLTPQDTFDLQAYNDYSRLYLPATYAMTYMIALALSTCIIVHTVLYHGQALLNGVKRINIEKDDIHAKLMRNYPEVPDWWYGTAFVIFFCLAIVTVEVLHTSVPVWALLLALLIAVVYILPGGFIFAMTGQTIGVNVLAQVIPGTLMPGNPVANMVFKAYSVQTLAQATYFVQDLKLGHYMKIPPRSTFLAQAVATTVAAFAQVAVKQWMFRNIPDICTPAQKGQLTCPHTQVFYTASVMWGLIGPSRQFGSGGLYHPQLFGMIVGAFLPIPFWLWQRKYPKSWVQYISIPVILTGVGYIPPATGINYSAWFAVAFVFQYLIRRRNFRWWSKFNYVTSAALDIGTATSLIFIFFTLQYPKGGSISVNWWGNNVWMRTADYRHLPFRTDIIPS